MDLMGLGARFALTASPCVAWAHFGGAAQTPHAGAQGSLAAPRAAQLLFNLVLAANFLEVPELLDAAVRARYQRRRPPPIPLCRILISFLSDYLYTHQRVCSDSTGRAWGV